MLIFIIVFLCSIFFIQGIVALLYEASVDICEVIFTALTVLCI